MTRAQDTAGAGARAATVSHGRDHPPRRPGAPKDRYRTDPASARIPTTATGDYRDFEVTATVDGFAGAVRAELHAAAGGDGADACSADLLLQALLGCAGVTLRAVATAMGVEIRSADLRADGWWDVARAHSVSTVTPPLAGAGRRRHAGARHRRGRRDPPPAGDCHRALLRRGCSARRPAAHRGRPGLSLSGDPTAQPIRASMPVRSRGVVVVDEVAGADVAERGPHPLQRDLVAAPPTPAGRAPAGAGRRSGWALVFQSTTRKVAVRLGVDGVDAAAHDLPRAAAPVSTSANGASTAVRHPGRRTGRPRTG